MEPYGIGSFGTVIRGKERDSNKDVAIKQVPNQINDLHSDIISDLFI
jgi:serine/threonine protein kinase